MPALREEFADHDVVVVDVVAEFRRHRSWVARAAVAAVSYYGVDFLRRTRNPKDALLRTPTAARLLRRAATQAVAGLGVEPSVTLQIQSLFDAHLDGVPHFVYTDHTHLANLQYANFSADQLYAKRWIECERAIYAHATMCFARSTHIAKSLQADYAVPADRVSIVHAGINAEPVALADPATAKQIVFVGLDWTRKGGPTLLAAFSLVRLVHPDASLVVVGYQPDDSSEAPLGVQFRGRVALSAVSELLAQSSVFCMPTTVEPFGIAFLEAMACGLPVVATEVGALPDIVEDGRSGRLVPVGDAQALAEALIELLADPELRVAAGQRGAQIIRERYNWPAVTRAMAASMRPDVARQVVPASRRRRSPE